MMADHGMDGAFSTIVKCAGDGMKAVALLVSFATSHTYAQALQRLDDTLGEMLEGQDLAEFMQSLAGIDFVDTDEGRR